MVEGLGLVPYSVKITELKHIANLNSTTKVVPKAPRADGIEATGPGPVWSPHEPKRFLLKKFNRF